ncbi:hypothetical protein KW830_08220 [Comamonas sp. CMM03]|uniref:hypothetical protein n=1 Tax=Comamonas sp. CMM03 TaxID=2854781 RepID=UPI001C45F68E|nr:hypothetical protein [Comamonas sp. CMM03]MBV7418440.1 hypothetical protein [Comamonas sp. CMM03]
MITQIDPISTPPTPADTPADFEQKASQVWADLFKAVPQMNEQAQQIEAIGQATELAKQSAQTSSDAALGYRNEATAAKNAAQAHAGSAAQSLDAAGAERSAAEAAANRAETAAEDAESIAANSVKQTAATGAALLPEGSDALRPAAGSIPAGYLLIRGNTQDAADYKPEFWDRVAGAWRALASRTWVLAKIQELLDAAIGSTYIYPNGGSQASPASVAVNSRYVMANPYPGLSVICEVQLQYGGVWGGVGGFITVDGTGSTTNGFGILARQHADTIVVQTGSAALMVSSAYDGNPFGITGNIVNPLPCRVRVNKVKG